ncbi:hypothetical protein B5F40_12275 [Gordonibacter sp. An230]|uniref:TorD/DmsD family molecular chaperone n=1 Tax=Gordonibacter sp. An230 TaxID=1965592 RepID=UPI000B3A6660|nr:molecular chaperone TorD family protein [Gordonibacter sp. An230]OUO88627.1 hypothetical protein B5F40_12275 [Gordonibacter sp. An230]
MKVWDPVGEALRRAVGMSDMAALLAAAFRFPEDGRLADALVDGSFLADWEASLGDARGAAAVEDERLIGRCRELFEGADREALRREYSYLFLTPGVDVPVWPYESCFLHRASVASGAPSLFRTRCALDVERQMAEAGVASASARTEPVDSVFLEFEFLAFLHARHGEALRREEGSTNAEGGAPDDAGPALWAQRIALFSREHALAWLPRFMDEVRERDRLGAYQAFASLGVRYLGELEADACMFEAGKG